MFEISPRVVPPCTVCHDSPFYCPPPSSYPVEVAGGFSTDLSWWVRDDFGGEASWGSRHNVPFSTPGEDKDMDSANCAADFQSPFWSVSISRFNLALLEKLFLVKIEKETLLSNTDIIFIFFNFCKRKVQNIILLHTA